MWAGALIAVALMPLAAFAGIFFYFQVERSAGEKRFQQEFEKVKTFSKETALPKASPSPR